MAKKFILNKTITKLIAIIGLLSLINPYFVYARLFPHIKTASVSYGITSGTSDATLKEYADSFDILIGPYSSKLSKLKSYNPELITFRYDNFTNIYNRSNNKKWLYLEEYCFQHGLDIEDQFVHFSEDSVITNSGTPKEDKLGDYSVANYTTDTAGVLVYDGSNYKNYSGGQGTYPANVPFGGANQIIYFGHGSKFFKLIFDLSTVSTGWTGTWEYWNGNNWQSLSVNDGTQSMNQSGTINFIPPTNWTWGKINDKYPGFWIRLRTTSAGSNSITANSIKKESYYIYQGSSGKYLVPGWDPANDQNGNGFIDDIEFTNLINPNATARMRYQSRVPNFYWAPERFMTNLGSAAYREINTNYAATEATELFNETAYDGIFEDNCVFNDGSIPWNNPFVLGHYTINSGGHYIEYPGESPGTQFTRDHLIADTLSYQRLKSINKYLIGNPSQVYADNAHYNFSPVDKITITDGDKGGYFASNSHDGVFWEYWMIPKASISYQGAWSDPVQGVLSQINYVKDLTIDGGKIGFYHVRSSELTNTADFSAERERMYGLAHFYLVSDNNNAYFLFTQGGYNSYFWWEAIEYDIGTATGDARVYQSGTDSSGQTYYIYARDYTNALILTKPLPKWDSKFKDNESPITTVQLSENYYRLNYDGTLQGPISSVTLKNLESAILIKNPGGIVIPQHSYNLSDFANLYTKWHTSDTTYDLNKDGMVNSRDLALMMKSFSL